MELVPHPQIVFKLVLSYKFASSAYTRLIPIPFHHSNAMQEFALKLSGGGVISGRHSSPQDRSRFKVFPILICLHGGSYDSEYFDSSEEYSISRVTDLLNVPVILITRPGYSQSPPLSPFLPGDTYSAHQGRYLNSVVLPEIWNHYGKLWGATSVVLLGHSIGAMIATITAGCYTGNHGYPLAGLITSAIGSEATLGPKNYTETLLSKLPEFINYEDLDRKDALMLQLPSKSLVDPQQTKYTAQLDKPIPAGEIRDIYTEWSEDWQNKVTVPILNGIGEFDTLFVPSKEALDKYRDAFPASPKVEVVVVPQAPHCIELSYQARSWLIRCCGFAYECAFWKAATETSEL
jgi:pimeloyl-ACP methyl ester carboxylesterase